MRFPNKYGGIVKNGGKRRRPYQVRITVGWDDTGKQLYETLGFFEKKEDAINCLAEYNQKPYDIKAKEITFDQLYNNWVKDHFDSITNSTKNSYKTAKKYCKQIDNIKFCDIRTIHLQRVIDDCPKYSIRKNIRILLNMLYKYAEKLDIADKRYSQYIELGKPVKVYEKTPFTEEEVQLLFDNVDKIPYIDTILAMVYTGTRITELLELLTEKVHLDERYMIGGKKTEAGTDRVLPLSKKILPYIEKYYNQGNKYLITMDGKSITYAQYKKYIWNPIMDKLGLKKKPHECRHTTATWLKNAGVDELTRKRILGHSTQDITDRYTHTSIKQLIDAIDRI